MERVTINGFLKRLASKKPTPGGGSVAALSGAAAAGLVSMVAKISKEDEIAEKSERLMGVLVTLISRDAEAFEAVIKKEPSLEKALKRACEVPLETLRYSYGVLKLIEDLSARCDPRVITDLQVAAKMAQAAAEGALLNIKVNLISIRDEEFKKEINEEIDSLSF